MIICNALSLNMYNPNKLIPMCTEINKQEVNSLLGLNIQSAIGHPDLAAIVSNQLGIKVPNNRETLYFDTEDIIIIAQYKGKRLPEGATMLPKDSIITYYKCEFINKPLNK